MCNHKVIKLLLVTLLISYKTWAAQIFDFETLSNPSYQMSATLRIENLLLLSQSEPNNAEKCLNEIFLITRGKYGFSKRSATLDERKTVVSALFAYRQLTGEGRSNPFSGGAIGEVSKDISENVANHLMVLEQGYEKIAALNDSTVNEFEVFGVTLKVADLFVQPKVTPLDVDGFDQHSHHSRDESDSRDKSDPTEFPQFPGSDGKRADSPVVNAPMGSEADNSSHSQKGDEAGACELPPQVQETQEDVLTGSGDFDGEALDHLSSARSSPVGDGEGSSPVHEIGGSSGDEGDGEPPKFGEEEEQAEGDDNADGSESEKPKANTEGNGGDHSGSGGGEQTVTAGAVNGGDGPTDEHVGEEEEQAEGDDNADGSEEDELNPEMTSESDAEDAEDAGSRPYTPADDAGTKPCCQRNKEDRGCVIS